MRFGWMPRSPCDQARDRILAATADTRPGRLPDDLMSHLETCSECRELAEAQPVVHRLGTAWKSAEPPPGLVQRTLTGLEPHWRRAERPVSRREVRLLWSGGLALAGTLSVVALVLLDRAFQITPQTDAGEFLWFSLRVGLVYLTVGSLLSVGLLVGRSLRSNHRRTPAGERRPGDKPDGAGRK